MAAVIVIAAVSLALIVGALWGVFGLGVQTEGFVVALAGGALMVAAVLELIEPALHDAPLAGVASAVIVGAGTYVWLTRALNRRLGRDSGSGLLTAVTLDGVPENVALGVALIGTPPSQVAALAGSILLSNLPEAAGGAREMRKDHGTGAVLAIWAGTAVLLAGAALLGYHLLEDASATLLALVQAFAGGAVVGSLATTVFPDAFEEDSYATGVATAIGLIVAIALHRAA